MNLLKCDHCGKTKEFDSHELRLIQVYHYNFYGREEWDYNVHLCKDCLIKIFGKV